MLCHLMNIPQHVFMKQVSSTSINTHLTKLYYAYICYWHQSTSRVLNPDTLLPISDTDQISVTDTGTNTSIGYRTGIVSVLALVRYLVSVQYLAPIPDTGIGTDTWYQYPMLISVLILGTDTRYWYQCRYPILVSVHPHSEVSGSHGSNAGR